MQVNYIIFLKKYVEFNNLLKNRGKHTNRTQNSIFIEFIEKYPDLAKGFTKLEKPTVDSFRQQLTKSLNTADPPQKDVNGWKKIWTEWKREVKRKLAQNKTETRATGGGPYSKYQFTQTEENARIFISPSQI